MTEPLKLDRTWLCSVLFLDIVQYSRQTLEIQTRWKEHFNRLLAEAIKESPEADRVILDTGDGAAICFLGDPETAMFAALRLVSGLAEDKTDRSIPLRVRAGINLGSVKLVKDINGNLNAVGDGMNVAQRVMSFAEENQILVSRSFYEVASSISESYAGLFKYEGVRTDKHVREHTLYQLHPPEATRTTLAEDTGTSEHTTSLTDSQLATVEQSLTVILGPIAPHLVRTSVRHVENPQELRDALLSLIPTQQDRERFLANCGGIFSDAAPSAPASPTVPAAWDPGVLDRARQELAAYIGPLARVLVERAAERTRAPAALYQLLAAEIPSPRDREKFLRQTPA